MGWFKSKKDVEKEAREREIANTRGQAGAYAATGAVGGLSYAAIELLNLATNVNGGDLDWAAKSVKNVSRKTWKRVGFATGIVALGALGVAIYKHHHANQLEEEQKRIDSLDIKWETRVTQTPDNSDLQR